MIDKYFIRPVFWDFVIGVLISALIVGTICKYACHFPNEGIVVSTASDLSTVALTLSGFILTLLTVLISFKSTSKSKKEISLEKDSLYEIFYATDLYFETVRHLKNAIISLTTVAVCGYTLKLALDPKNYILLFAFDLFSLVIIFLTLWRCLFILSKIIKIQKES